MLVATSTKLLLLEVVQIIFEPQFISKECKYAWSILSSIYNVLEHLYSLWVDQILLKCLNWWSCHCKRQKSAQKAPNPSILGRQVCLATFSAFSMYLWLSTCSTMFQMPLCMSEECWESSECLEMVSRCAFLPIWSILAHLACFATWQIFWATEPY